MGKLKAAHVKELNDFLTDHDLFAVINKHLKSKGMDFVVQSIKLQPRLEAHGDNPCANFPCPPGQTPRQVCRPSGICECECVG